MNAIETHNLTKVYNNNFKAVNSLNLEIPDKSIFGMLGPNGAGKTTLLNLIAGLYRPDGGNITVYGGSVRGVAAIRGAGIGGGDEGAGGNITIYDGSVIADGGNRITDTIQTIRKFSQWSYINH